LTVSDHFDDPNKLVIIAAAALDDQVKVKINCAHSAASISKRIQVNFVRKKMFDIFLWDNNIKLFNLYSCTISYTAKMVYKYFHFHIRINNQDLFVSIETSKNVHWNF
jgi:hypothetical protein